MADDIKTLVEDQIRKWKMVEELNADPNFAHLFVRKAAPTAKSEGPANANTKRIGKVQVIPANGDQPLRTTAHTAKAVLSTLSRLPSEITTEDIEKEIVTTPGFKRGTRNINIAVNDALDTLEKRGGLVERTRRKKGFRKIWRNLQSQQTSAESRTA
ncbi:MAG TPA: hypothetical protein VH350_16830 [Candidatus Sulfotelmatobacter sp.]|jgi:hypothetical protein|nr:hypothetical protein [Candidatus Sulfotelmatobacter sp.]